MDIVVINLNNHELDLLIQASIATSKSSLVEGNYMKSNDLVKLSDKLATAKDELKWQRSFGKEEKPARES